MWEREMGSENSKEKLQFIIEDAKGGLLLFERRLRPYGKDANVEDFQQRYRDMEERIGHLWEYL